MREHGAPDEGETGIAEVTLDLTAGVTPALRAVVAGAQRTGSTVETIVELGDVTRGEPSLADAPAARGRPRSGRGCYRLVARRAPSGRSGPLLTVFDLSEMDGGVTRVRIVQYGFGDERAWRELMREWGGAGATGRDGAGSEVLWGDERSERSIDPTVRTIVLSPRGPHQEWGRCLPDTFGDWPPLGVRSPLPPGWGSTCLPGLGTTALDRLSPQGADPKLVANVIRALNELAELMAWTRHGSPAGAAGAAGGVRR